MSSMEVISSRRRVALAALIGAMPLMWGPRLHAQSQRAIVWHTESAGIQPDVLGSLQRSLAGVLPVSYRSLDRARLREVEPGVGVQVVLGSRTLREWVAARQRMPEWLASTPVFAGLLPRAPYEAMARALPAGSSAVWLDQPEERYFALLARAFPRQRRVGVLSGPQVQTRVPELEAAARQAGWRLTLSPLVQTVRDLPLALNAVLDKSDVLLALPDPAVFRNDTLLNILIASYRQRVPLVGYTESQVRSGAALGLYTRLTDVSRQLTDGLIAWLAGGRLPAPAPAFRGAVAINAQVARSLDLELPDESILENSLLGGRP